MAELTESKMNFAALKRVDPYAKSLLETSTHVALYTFVSNAWKKTEIEGALFVYSRTGEPFHNILIMNRLNMKNLVEPVTPGLDLQLQDPFLLYKTPHGLIYGIWFYDKEECVKIAATLTKIIKEASEGQSDKKERSAMEAVGNNVDIFSMLTRAQEEYNSKSPRKNPPEVLGTPLDVNFNFKETDLTPQSVMDFFAKASNGSKFIHDPSLIQPPGMFLNSPRSAPPPGLTRMSSVPITIPPPQNDVKPLLQRLMSNPVHSVEHIEKQQQCITTQCSLMPMREWVRNGNSGLSNSNGSDDKNGISSSVKPSTSVIEHEKPTIAKPTVIIPQNQIEESLGFLRITDSPPSTNTVHSQQFYNSKLIQNHSPLMGDGPETHINHSEYNRPLSAPMETHLKPALMPPVMFTSSVKKEDNLETISTMATITSANVNSASGNNSYNVQPEPLTKNQLLQAVNYLLKHDPEFINKLHEAYVKSFAELVS